MTLTPRARAISSWFLPSTTKAAASTSLAVISAGECRWCFKQLYSEMNGSEGGASDKAKGRITLGYVNRTSECNNAEF
jgi:hypothetical protein